MIKQRKPRRIISLTLIALGAILMFLATEMTAGVILFALGILLEFIGIRLEHHKER